MIDWMSYAAAVGILAWGAALAVERLTVGRSRWIWAGALAIASLGVLVRPVLALLSLNPRGLDITLGAPAPAPAAAGLAATGEAAARGSLPVGGVALALWVGASALLLIRLWIGVRRLRARQGRWTPAVVDGVPVLISPGTGPAVVGTLRPRIVVPRWLLERPEAERRLVLRHEEEHRRRRDPLLLAAGLMAPVVLPWSPGAWLAFARLRDAVELDCDRRVLARSRVRPAAYARLLLDVSLRSGPVPLGAGFGERPSPMERRIRTMMTDGPDGRRRAGRAARVGMAALLLVAACTLDVNVTMDGARDEGSEAADGSRIAPAADAPAGDVRDPREGIVRDARFPEGTEVVEVAGRSAEEVKAAGPSFTPFTTAPRITNRSEVIAAMEAAYPAELRDAGVGGTVRVYFFIDDEGAVQDVRVDRSSGHPALDRAALQVARTYRFEPALNRDVRVPVWVSFPITFRVKS